MIEYEIPITYSELTYNSATVCVEADSKDEAIEKLLHKPWSYRLDDCETYDSDFRDWRIDTHRKIVEL